MRPEDKSNFHTFSADERHEKWKKLYQSNNILWLFYELVYLAYVNEKSIVTLMDFHDGKLLFVE